MSALLDVALLGLNPDRARRLLAEGVHGGVAVAPGERRWPVPGVDFVQSEALPIGLRELPDAPKWLFARGELPSGPAVAIIGSRRATRYGLDLAREIGRRIGAAGWPVVSGLALGIDAAAHEGCLDAGGTAVAVLGSGIDVWYPRQNQDLGKRILASGGAVVSEFGPGVAPEPWRFPFRNRIISGLSAVVIVVEAAERSGALITSNQALMHGREVMAVPGDIHRATSRGCNLLIRDGAHPIAGLDDLVETIELWLGASPGSGDGSPALSEEVAALGVLPSTIDEIVERTGKNAGDVMLEIIKLQSLELVSVNEGIVRPLHRP